MSATSTSSPQAESLISAMHARYEASYEEYNILDNAELALGHTPADVTLASRLDDAKKANNAETDALRIAVLYQVPDSWADALILQFHIYNMRDMVANADVDRRESEALSVAIETLLDFMCCTVEADHEQIGASFQRAANNVFFRRRRRTGVLEG